MAIALGIDTGGTFTDAALFDQDTGCVLAAAKALTTPFNLALGIQDAVRLVFAPSAVAQLGSARLATPPTPHDVALVGLSTTLATNAMAEGQGGPVCLILIGYDRDLMRSWGFEAELGTADYVYVAGGHNEMGDQAAPLDEQGLAAAVAARRDHVEAFAVSAYFGVRNPAHELRARELIRDLSGLPVTCGHELSSRLNAVRRATTAALNARLIAPLTGLIGAVRVTLAGAGIAAPLMVVKGDGSLVSAEWALARPVETILSGPAASVVGARHLAGEADAWVVDMGGTTTDIAVLREGYPILNADGASVGGWRTMVQAIDVQTTGLGGDSHVQWVRAASGEGRLTLGPRRAIPLCLLASEHPNVVDELACELRAARSGEPAAAGEFIALGRPPAGVPAAEEAAILALLGRGPQPAARLAAGTGVGRERSARSARMRLEDLGTHGLVRRSAFTPTDALHALGELALWDAQAACLGAELLALAAGMTPGELCRAVVAEAVARVAEALTAKALEDDMGTPPAWSGQPVAARLLELALRDGNAASATAATIATGTSATRTNATGTAEAAIGATATGAAGTGGTGTAGTRTGAAAAGASAESRAAGIACALTLPQPIVAIGAPVGAYLPAVAARLHTRLIIPPHAEVANAVGAVAGGVVQRRQVLIEPLAAEDGPVRAFLPGGHRDFASLEAAVDGVRGEMTHYMGTLALTAGAVHVEVRMEREDHWAHTQSTVEDGEGGELGLLFLGSDLSFTAAGRPALLDRA